MLTTESSDANIKCASFSANKFEVKHLDWKHISKEGSIKPTAVSWAPLPQKTTHLWNSSFFVYIFIYIYKLYIAIKKQNQFLSFNITESLGVSFATDPHQEHSNVLNRSFLFIQGFATLQPQTWKFFKRRINSSLWTIRKKKNFLHLFVKQVKTPSAIYWLYNPL